MAKKADDIPANAPIWLFTGPEIGERAQEIASIKKELETKNGTADSHIQYAGDVAIGDIISVLQNGNLFAATRFVELRNAEVIKKKEDLEQLRSWILTAAAHPDEAYLILVSDETAVDKKLEALIPPSHKKIFWEMFENRKEQWIRTYLKKCNCSISQDGIEALLELVENNTQALAQECTRLSLYYPTGTTITGEQVEAVLAHNREESPFTLFAKMTCGDLEGTLDIYQKLSSTKNVSGVQIIASLTSCFRRLLDWHAVNRGGRPSDFDLKRIGFGSARMKDQYSKAARLWDENATHRILATLAETDIAVRTNGTQSEETRMELLLYTILKKQGILVQTPVYSD